MPYELEHHFVQTNGVKLHVVQAGPTDGPLLILLHGFPEYWYGWRKQIGPLAERGFRVWAPDQRGYNLSDKPADMGAYTIDTLAADVVGLIEAAGQERAVVVGHDWGAIVAWWLGATYPQRVERLVILNVPHPLAMKRFISRSPDQMRRSWYIGFFQIPALPEALMRVNNWWAVARMMQASSRPGTFSDEDLSWYRTAWSGAMTTMIHWYRAFIQRPPKRSQSGQKQSLRITVPTLLLWGVRDQFLKREMAQLSIDLCDDGQLVFFENATHWLQHEEPGRVTELIAAGRS